MRAVTIELADRRIAERHPLSRDADVEVAGDDIYPASLINISQSGCRLMVDGDLASASLIWIRVSDFPEILARIAWVDGTVLGCRFDKLLSRTRLLALREIETTTARRATKK